MNKHICADCFYKGYNKALKTAICSYNQNNERINKIKECPLGITENDIKMMDDLTLLDKINGVLYTVK